MRLLMTAFKKPVVLESAPHRGIRIYKPKNYEFMRDVEIVPLAYSELLAATMYYPVMFGYQEGYVFPFAVVGVNKRNIYLTEEGDWKVKVIPKVCQYYPFGLIKEKEEEYLVVIDEACISDVGEELFDSEGNETEYFSQIKKELTDLAKDLNEAEKFSLEVFQSGYLKSLNLEVETKAGKMQFKNVWMANAEVLSTLQPEKLYYLNSRAYLLILHAQYLSMRNFLLFDLL